MIDKKEILISDMTTCIDNSAISDGWGFGLWHKVPYETEDGVSGVMLFAEPGDKAAPLTYKLNASGKYKIYVGMNYGFSIYQNAHTNRLTEWDYGAAFLKLSDDRGFQRIGAEKYDVNMQGGEVVSKYRVKFLGEKKGKASFSTIYDAYWKTADLTGQDIIVAPQLEPYDNKYYGQLSNISYIRLVPVTDEDEALEKEIAPTDDTKTMAALWCTGALTGHTSGQAMYHPTSKEWFEMEFEPFRNSDFGIFSFEAMRGGLCEFKTKIGDVGSDDGKWDETWLDPLEEFTKLAKEAGMKTFASIRMIGSSRPYSRYPINRAKYYWDRIEFAKKSKDGGLCGNLSLAYPEVRKFWIDLASEALAYGIDGIQLHFNRCSPFVMYEEPVLETFKAKYGVDMKELSIEDDRVIRHTSEYVTQYLRELRAELDKKPGRMLSVMVKDFDEFDPSKIYNQCDVETWIKEGLVDIIYMDHGNDIRYINYWKGLAKGRVKILQSIMPRTQPGESYAQRAQEFFDAGADGIMVWDCERRVQRISEWNVLKHLGSKQKAELLEKVAPSYFSSKKLKTHNGLDVKFSYTDG